MMLCSSVYARTLLEDGCALEFLNTIFSVSQKHKHKLYCMSCGTWLSGSCSTEECPPSLSLPWRWLGFPVDTAWDYHTICMWCGEHTDAAWVNFVFYVPYLNLYQPWILLFFSRIQFTPGVALYQTILSEKETGWQTNYQVVQLHDSCMQVCQECHKV